MKTSIKILLFFLPLSAFANQDFKKLINNINKKNNTPIITIEKLSNNFGEYQILDTREYNEFKVSSIKGALFAGYKTFDLTSTVKKLDKNKPIVVYCSLGVRSGKIAKKLIKKGFKVFNLSGGIFGWHNQGQKVYDSNGSLTDKVHGYNKKWSKWVLKGERIY